MLDFISLLHNAHTFIEKLVVYKEVNICVLNLVLLHITHILKTINRVAELATRIVSSYRFTYFIVHFAIHLVKIVTNIYSFFPL